ncbi:MAG: NfeD family protein [Verrucomicrobiota bacterium]
MDPMTQWYIFLLACGLLLIGAEIFVPGGILGAIGGLFLIAAMVIGFIAFEAPWNFLSAILILILSITILLGFIRYLPKSRIFNKLALTDDLAESKGTDERDDLNGLEGVAETPMRPSGIVSIDGKRHDVVAEGSFIDSGSRVKVIRVEGNLITVREIAGT